MKILTIIVTYNGAPWIRACLESVFRSDVPLDCMLIDNASTDETLALVGDDPRLEVVKSDTNLGFGKANNIGLKKALEAGYDYVLLLNQDARIEPDMVGRLLAERKEGVLSPLHFNGRGTDLDKAFASYLKCSGIADYRRKYGVEKSLSPNFVNAAVWLIPTSVVVRVGGFDPLFYHYGEDKDWCNRLRFHGYPVTVVPGARAYHDREERPLTAEKRYYVQEVYFRTELKNIAYPLWKAYAMGALAVYKELLLALKSGDGKGVVTYLKMALAQHRLLPAVLRSRKQCKKREPPFLN